MTHKGFIHRHPMNRKIHPVQCDMQSLPDGEKVYLEAIHQMGGTGRVARACGMYHEMHAMLSHRISCQYPNLTERQVRIKVAERMYLSDSQALQLLKQAASDD